MVRFILPVKGQGRGKTRLGLAPPQRSGLTRAMLRDCLSAVLAADLGPVVVVSPDREIRELAAADGAEVLDHAGGLDEAVLAATGAGRCAALLPDLPAVRPAELTDVIGRFDEGFVADATGTGTTLLFGTRLRPRFGPDSAARHTAAGYSRIDLPLCGLRLDVDTLDDLRRACHLGVGSHTAKWLAESGADPTVRIGP